jgi:hypothetical protein
VVLTAETLVCGRPQENAINRTAELNEKEGNFDFMTISVLASNYSGAQQQSTSGEFDDSAMVRTRESRQHRPTLFDAK